MKSRKRQFWRWTIGIGLCLAIIGIIVAKSVFNLAVGTINTNRIFLLGFVADYFDGKSVKDRILVDSQKAVINGFAKQLKEKGRFVSVGEPETVPIASDLLNRCKELSYNLPVVFEKGTVTFTFRVCNEESGQRIVWSSATDGVLARESFRRRVTGQLPESSYKNSPRW